MNKKKKILISILIILIFLCLLIPRSYANFFTDDWDNPNKEEDTIESTIENDEGGIFEKIIAKMIGGIAQSVFTITTNEELGVGFKNYDELIFAFDSTDLAPFTQKQWKLMMKWYGTMTLIAGSLILIVVVVTAYKIIIGGYSIDKRNEAKDSLMRLFFGVASIGFAPIFVKFLLFLNNNLVRMIVGYSTGGLDELLGNNVISNIQTGNAIATAIVIALFAYLFFKINVKFIIRHFTILVFTLFTPIISIMWILNKRAIGASIWFGQILINVFMQFIFAFLFLIYMQFLPQSGGWATSILWAMMILPIADALQNTLQNLVSRIAGINNDELANRGIGMAGAMAHSVNAIAYQFKNPNNNLNETKNSFLGSVFSKENTESTTTNNVSTEMNKTKMESKPMETTRVAGKSIINKNSDTKVNNVNNNSKTSFARSAFNAGKEFVNMGMYMAEGRNFANNRTYNRHGNINNTRKEDYKSKEKEDSEITNMQEQTRYDNK